MKKIEGSVCHTHSLLTNHIMRDGSLVLVLECDVMPLKQDINFTGMYASSFAAAQNRGLELHHQIYKTRDFYLLVVYTTNKNFKKVSRFGVFIFRV